MFGGLRKLRNSDYGDVKTARNETLGLRPSDFVQGGVKSLAQKLEKLPAPSQGSVASEARQSVFLQESAAMHKQILASRAVQLKALVEMHDGNVQHQKNFMGASLKMAGSDAEFQKAFMQHGLGIAKEQAEVDGYSQALEGARTLWS